MTSDELQSILPHAKRENIERFAEPLSAAMMQFSIDENADRECHFIAQIAVESASLNAVSENLNYSADALVKIFHKYFDAATAADYARQPERIANRIYANRMGNGDEASGDGWRYRGAGLIQTTGHDNQARVAKFFDVAIEEIGDWLRTPDGAAKSAGLFWHDNGLNAYADNDDTLSISGIINVGNRHATTEQVIGWGDRVAYLRRARAVLA